MMSLLVLAVLCTPPDDAESPIRALSPRTVSWDPAAMALSIAHDEGRLHWTPESCEWVFGRSAAGQSDWARGLPSPPTRRLEWNGSEAPQVLGVDSPVLYRTVTRSQAMQASRDFAPVDAGTVSWDSERPVLVRHSSLTLTEHNRRLPGKTGQHAELRLLLHPRAVVQGESLPFRTYVDAEARGQQVRWSHWTGTSPTPTRGDTETDTEGFGRLPDLRPGRWQLAFIAVDERGDDVMWTTATLTFTVDSEEAR